MNKVLVTGATGFVGREACNALRQRSVAVVPVVRHQTADGQFAIGNMTGETQWADALAGCDTVLHLAARVHVMNDQAQDPLRAYREANVDTTMNLARQAVQQGVRRFVFVSSVKVNGESTGGKPFSADDVPAPVDPYGVSKLEAESALQDLARQSGLEVVVVRPPLVYGPGVRANFLKLMQLVRLGLPLPFKSVQNRRSMVGLENLADFLIRCAEHPAAPGKVWMVSDGEDLSMPELVARIAQAMGRRPPLLPFPPGWMMACAKVLGKADVASRLLGSLQVDIGASRQLLAWQPPVKPEIAVQKTVAHFLAQR
jgi:nucleoside-diphosphate-sugar epimerase